MLIPDTLLQNKNILLGVSGSIAAYKSLELVRLFVKAGANVRVIMTSSAKKFVTPLSFETLTSNEVLDDTNESWLSDHNHIKIGEWADVFLIAPATANTMAKLANGIADNILLQCALAYPSKKLLAPSANTNMITNSITQENIKKLLDAQYVLISTQIKELACKTIGDGAMAEPINIFWAIAKALLEDEFWKNTRAVVTGGGTIEKIDDVRYISNFSSGKMASSLATALYCKGADVALIATKYEENIPNEIEVIKVQSAREMQRSLTDSLEIQTGKKTNYLFMAAAVSDYIPTQTQAGKLKKEDLGDSINLSLTKGIDILTSVDKNKLISIGFKAEMDVQNAHKNASKSIETKGLNAVCLNILKDDSSFGTDDNTIEFISKKESISILSDDKLSVAFEILKHSKEV